MRKPPRVPKSPVTSNEVPHVVAKTVEYLDAKALQVTGIYRESASATELKKLKEEFRTKPEVDLTPYRDPHTIAGCLKAYFREMQVPVFTRSCTKGLMDVEGIENDEQRCRAFGDVMKAYLSPDSVKMISFLFAHLNRICANQEFNKMSAPNLAICWGPTLFRGGASVFGIVVHLIHGNLVPNVSIM